MDQINNIVISAIDGDKDTVTNLVNDILAQRATQALANYSTVEEEVSELDESEQLDELSKDTLKSYLKKAPATLYSKGMENGKKHAQADEIDRFTNRNGGLGGYKVGDELKSKAGVDSKETEKIRTKAFLRNKSIGKAVDKLTK